MNQNDVLRQSKVKLTPLEISRKQESKTVFIIEILVKEEVVIWTKIRSSHQRCSMKKGVLRNFTKFTGKYLCQGLFFNKVAGLRPATLLKKRLWHRCFPVNFVKFLRASFLQNTSGRLLLKNTIYSALCHLS